MDLPVSLRTAQSEWDYQNAKTRGETIPLELEPAIKKFEHWRVIENRFPYNVAYKTHHMLLPKRAGVSERKQLNETERAEFEKILEEFIDPEYHKWFVNCPGRRSVAGFYHIHLVKYHEKREDMSL